MKLAVRFSLLAPKNNIKKFSIAAEQTVINFVDTYLCKVEVRLKSRSHAKELNIRPETLINKDKRSERNRN